MKERFKKGPVVLVILDGWGEWDNAIGNPIKHAHLPTFEMLDKNYPKLLLEASGPAVGLPWGVYGNSEVGHQTLGSGQIIFQYLPVIDAAIQTGEIENKESLRKVFAKLKENKGTLHFWGLCSDGGVHSNIDHLFVLFDIARDKGIKDIVFHVVTDGRDTTQKEAIGFVERIQSRIKKAGVGKIASVSGRYYTMDRNNNWDRIEKAYLAMVSGVGEKFSDPVEAIEKQYKDGNMDEYLEPVVIVDKEDNPVATIQDNDAVFCFNYRKDRARQMTKAFILDDVVEFKTKDRPQVDYICMTEYEEGLGENIIFSPQKITTRLGDILSKNNLTQLRTAETEKFAHVTYFFNGGLEEPFLGEKRLFVPSKNCKSYADKPEMSAFEVTDGLIKAFDKDFYDFVLINYANSDMVGHTGVFEAGVKTCEVVDVCLKKLMDFVLEKDGCLLVTADHGNIEEMIKIETGQTDTEHSANPVPCWFVSPECRGEYSIDKQNYFHGSFMIADLAPTILDLFGIKKPSKMTGKSILKFFMDKV